MKLCANNVSYSYPDGTKAIEDVSLCISSGEIVCLLGPNGSGKSTLLLLLAGLIKPTSGSITVDGENLGRDYRKICGILFQNPSDQLIAPTVGEDVSLGPRQLKLEYQEIERRVKGALEALELLGFEDRSPFRLSGGEIARVALAGLIALDPEVYLLDEPSSSLDLKGMEALMEILRKLKEMGKIVVIATQDSDLASEVADKIYIFNKGKLISGGRVNILYEAPLEEIGVKAPATVKICKELSHFISECPLRMDDLINALKRALSSSRD
jgi:cobalt/nickel transport system ATP-binding protein